MGSHLSMLGLIYCMVTTFKYHFRREGWLGRKLNKLSYNVYIIHLIVVGVIVTALLGVDLPAIVKYPILAATAFAASNLAVCGCRRAVQGLRGRS